MTMKFEELVEVWREEESGEVRRTRVESLSDLRGRATRAEAGARRRFRRAAIIWLLMVPLFTTMMVLAISAGDFIVAAGFAAFVIGCTAPAVYLMKGRRTVADPLLPVRATLVKEVERLRELQRTIGVVLDWVAGALVIGGPLLAIGTSSSPFRIIVWSGLFVVVGINGRLAWRGYASRLRATSDELESWIADLDRI